MQLELTGTRTEQNRDKDESPWKARYCCLALNIGVELTVEGPLSISVVYKNAANTAGGDKILQQNKA